MSQRLDYKKISPTGVKELVSKNIPRSSLSQTLIDLIYLRVCEVNGCANCLDTHTRDLLERGIKVERLALLQEWPKAGELFDQRERAALALAEALVAGTGIPDDEYNAASAVFNEREIVDLIIAIGLMNAYNRVAHGAQCSRSESARAGKNR